MLSADGMTVVVMAMVVLLLQIHVRGSRGKLLNGVHGNEEKGAGTEGECGADVMRADGPVTRRTRAVVRKEGQEGVRGKRARRRGQAEDGNSPTNVDLVKALTHQQGA